MRFSCSLLIILFQISTLIAADILPPAGKDVFLNAPAAVKINRKAAGIQLELEMRKTADYDRLFPWMKSIDDPDQLLFVVVYEDGSRMECFPQHLPSQKFEVFSGRETYLLRTDSEKRIDRLEVMVKFPELRLNISNVAFPDILPEIGIQEDHYKAVTDITPAGVPFTAGRLRVESGEVTISGGNQEVNFKITTDRRLEFHSFRNTVLNAEMLSAGRSAVFRINYAGKCYVLNDFRLSGLERKENSGVAFQLESTAPEFPSAVRLELAQTIDGLQWSMSLHNNGKECLQNIDVDFPVFEGIQLGTPAAADYYLFPYHGGIIHNRDFEFKQEYLGETGYGEGVVFSLVALFNPMQNGVWYMIVQDLEGVRKHFGFKKLDTSNLWVNYFGRDLAPGETRIFPKTVTAATSGNWRNAVTGYRNWAYRTFYNPEKVGLDWFRKLFTLNMVFHHFENPVYAAQGLEVDTNEPRLGKWVDESAELGYGKFDYFHLQPHNWCVPPDWKTEARGDYEYTAKGGLENFRKQVADIHARHAYTGVYTEGTLASEHTAVGRKLGQKGQWIQQDGSPYKDYWGGKEREINYNMCVAYKPWQEHMAGVAKRILTDVPLDGFYLDQIGNLGFKVCYNPEHHHPWPDASCYPGQLELVRKVRSAMDEVNPNAALYTEGVGPELMMAERNGSFMWWTDYEQPRRQVLTAMMPSRMNLVRHIFPEVKIFEIPTWGENHTELRQAFFNGNGIYLQIGGADCPNYSSGGRQLVRQMHDLFLENGDAFVTDRVTMLYPVKSKHFGVYANKFDGANKTLFTLWNTAYTSDRLILPLPSNAADYTWRDAWNNTPLKVEYGSLGPSVSLPIGPRETGCVVGVRKADCEEK